MQCAVTRKIQSLNRSHFVSSEFLSLPQSVSFNGNGVDNGEDRAPTTNINRAQPQQTCGNHHAHKNRYMQPQNSTGAHIFFSEVDTPPPAIEIIIEFFLAHGNGVKLHNLVDFGNF